MIYTVILNSNLRVAGSTVANAVYNFDWTMLPEGDYTMTWGMCSANTAVSSSDVILVSADLGQSKVFLCSPTAIRAGTTNIIGTMIPNENTVNSFYYGDKNTNGPISMRRPVNNTFEVKLLTTASNPVPWVDSALAPMGTYILNLSFSKI